jgi:hypothetical protein
LPSVQVVFNSRSVLSAWLIEKKKAATKIKRFKSFSTFHKQGLMIIIKILVAVKTLDVSMQLRRILVEPSYNFFFVTDAKFFKLTHPSCSLLVLSFLSFFVHILLVFFFLSTSTFYFCLWRCGVLIPTCQGIGVCNLCNGGIQFVLLNYFTL